MKHFFVTCIIFTIGLCILLQINAQQQKKKTVAVLKFVNSGGVDKTEVSILTDRFNNFLVNTNVYMVLEREKMDAILKEQDFTMTDNCNSAECAVQIGQLLGMDLMIAGKVGKFGTVYTLDIRIIDVSTGEILRTKSENYKGEKEGLLNIVENMAYTIAGLTAPGKNTETTTEMLTTNDTSDEIKIGTVIETQGSLEIRCEMDGVLFIDDQQIGEVSAGTKVPVEKLKTGSHKIRIKSSSGEFAREILIEENKKAIITAQFEVGKSSGMVKSDDSKKNKVTLTSNETSTYKDSRNGKVYKTVKIGNQVWMAENLNYDAGKGCNCYDNSASNCEKYGRLYTWEAAKRAVPKGWHLPSKKEFETLLSNVSVDMEDAYEHIIIGGSSGFNALFGGDRTSNGNFFYMGECAYFWSSTEYDNSNAWYLGVLSGRKSAEWINYLKNNGFSMRCIKD